MIVASSQYLGKLFDHHVIENFLKNCEGCFWQVFQELIDFIRVSSCVFLYLLSFFSSVIVKEELQFSSFEVKLSFFFSAMFLYF